MGKQLGCLRFAAKNCPLRQQLIPELFAEGSAYNDIIFLLLLSNEETTKVNMVEIETYKK